MAKIISPVKGYTGVSAGVPFRAGIGNTEDARLIEWFKHKGYTIEVEPAAVPEIPKTQEHPEAPTPPSAPEEPEEISLSAELPAASEASAAEAPELPAEPATTAPSPFDKMTTAELKAYAAEKGVDISGITAKSNILAKIKASESGT